MTTTTEAPERIWIASPVEFKSLISKSGPAFEDDVAYVRADLQSNTSDVVNCGTPPDHIWVHPWRPTLYYKPSDSPDYTEYARADLLPAPQPAQDAGEWQPITTVPMDRSSFLIYCPESGLVYQAYRFEGEERFRMFNSGGRIIYQSPSHWQPLPEPPVNQQGDSK